VSLWTGDTACDFSPVDRCCRSTDLTASGRLQPHQFTISLFVGLAAANLFGPSWQTLSSPSAELSSRRCSLPSSTCVYFIKSTTLSTHRLGPHRPHKLRSYMPSNTSNVAWSVCLCRLPAAKIEQNFIIIIIIIIDIFKVA